MATVLERNGSYRIKVSCGYDIHGKQVTQYKTWRPSENMTERQIKKELERQCVLFEEECKKGQITASIKFEALAEEWFENYAKLNLKNSSFTRQRALTIRVYPAIGHMKLDKITSRDIQKFINDLAVNGRNLQNGKPISRKTVVHHLSFISSVFNYAIKMDMIKDNPCSRVTVPRGEKKEKDIYTKEEVKKLFELLKTAPFKYRMFFTLAVYSGFRRGELCGLEWKDIDWEHSVVNVRRTSNYTKLHGLYTDTTKTKRSVRSSKLPPIIMDMLKEYKEQQDREREQTGDKWVDTDRLFVQWNGQPMYANTPYNWYRRFCKKHDMRFCDVHSLRHINNMKTSLLKIRLNSHISPQENRCTKASTAVSDTKIDISLRPKWTGAFLCLSRFSGLFIYS